MAHQTLASWTIALLRFFIQVMVAMRYAQVATMFGPEYFLDDEIRSDGQIAGEVAAARLKMPTSFRCSARDDLAIFIRPQSDEP
jgi:hypothetical protein